MIKFFRKIRYNLMSENKTSKYFKYAIGEILLVVIGILIALQINTWNEQRKQQITVNKLFLNLESSLKTDSLALSSIITRSKNSMSSMNLALTTPADKLLSDYTNEELIAIPRSIFEGAYSFYPKMGIYNQMLSGNLMELIKSEELKDALLLYYDFRITRYRSLDPVMDDMYHQDFNKFMSEELKMNFFTDAIDPDANVVFDSNLILKLKDETRKLYDLSLAVDWMLKDLEKDINSLLVIIRKELGND